ncbi:hypothetical protein PO864_00560 [Providencia alcalifaciens]|uniref:Phage virion morphogenesis family n=1 Tax=Providencia alcalifaciens 205/92 TaxID=1256988 RepID=A0AAV3M1K1_9GAMM|nr:hypothetical protein [Providencia alcalifaciens]EUD09673.1 hypothetical protein HMPREF1563_2864 [Providencia alcalifaciens 205/92]WGZ54513.1 hypothetical protein PO864_00560 [Providencia alcalifaciens]
MIISGRLNKNQLADMQTALKGLELPPKKRQRFLWRMAKYGVIAAAKRNVKNQQSPDGRAWKARQSHYKKKMLRNMPKLLHIREMPQIEAVRIYLQGGKYRNGAKNVPAGVVGYAQQHGMNATVSRKQVQSQQSRDPARLATRKQARKLRDLGYQVKTGKRLKKPTIKQITETMSFNQAGLLIKKLRGKTAKASWTIDIPARVFLGMSDSDFKKALARQLQGIEFGADIKAQDMK